MLQGMLSDFHGTKRWYQNDKYHRVDGPAVEYADGTKHWYLNGKLHREDGPAVEFTNGDKWWYKNGKFHRVDGPAVISANGDKHWYVCGKLHRIDGPAVISANDEFRKNFKVTDPALRMGQAFHQHFKLEKITNPEAKAFADRIYEARMPEARDLIDYITDWTN